MTKLIGILIVAILVFLGWRVYLHYEQVANEDTAAKQEAVAAVVHGDQLPGLPQGLEPSFQAATQQGSAALKTWIKTYSHLVQDPRRAWIELDYAVLIHRDDPSEARRLFAAVKQRTSPSSPVWPRIKQLEATFQ